MPAFAAGGIQAAGRRVMRMTGIHGGDIYRNQVELDFSVNVNPLGMPREAEAALHEAVDRCMEYPDMEASRLTEAVSGMLGIPPQYLLFGNGASELFMGIVHALRPRKTLLLIPSFYGYEYAAGAGEGEILTVALKAEKNFVPDDDLLMALTQDIDLLFLANPNNPTGKLLERGYLERVLERCVEQQIVVVLDECFIGFCEEGSSVGSKLQEYTNLLIVRAFTKLYALAGVRLGYLIGSDQTLLRRIRRQLPEWNLSVPAQEAGAACAGQSVYRARTVEYVKREREFLSQGLRRLGFLVYDGEANFIFFYSEGALYEKLLRRGILIRDCGSFRGLEKGYYRIAVRSRRDNERLLKVMGECIEER